MDQKYYIFPFGDAGDKTVVQNNTQIDGTVSYEEGWGGDYELEQGVDPNALDVPRTQSNQLMFDATENIKQYQEHGFPEHITAADNDAVPFPYDIHAFVIALNGNVYESRTAANTDVPPTANWALASNVQRIDDLNTLSGVAANATNLGTFTGIIISDNTDIKTALQELETAAGGSDPRVDDLITLSGVASGATNLGTFTGTIIPDNQTNKQAFQALETTMGNLITLSGVAQDATNLGTFTGTTIPNSQTNKQAFQALETALEAIVPGTEELISTTAITAVATIDLALDSSTFKDFRIVIDGAEVTLDTLVFARLSTDGGSTFKSGASDYSNRLTNTLASGGNAFNGSSIALSLAASVEGTTGIGMYVEMKLPNLNNVDMLVLAEWVTSFKNAFTSPFLQAGNGLATLLIDPTTIPIVDFIRFATVAGTFEATGTIKVFGTPI